MSAPLTRWDVHSPGWNSASVQPGVLHRSQPLSASGHGVRQMEQRGSKSHVQTYSPHSQRAWVLTPTN